MYGRFFKVARKIGIATIYAMLPECVKIGVERVFCFQGTVRHVGMAGIVEQPEIGMNGFV